MPGWRLIVPALVIPFIGTLIYFVWLPDHPLGRIAYTAVKVFTLAYPIFFLLRLRRRRREQRGGAEGHAPGEAKHPQAPSPSPPRRGFTWWGGLGSGVVMALIIFAAWHSPLGDAVRQAAEVIRGQAEALGFAENFLLFAFWLSVVHSGIEEFYWRWLVFGSLRGLLPRLQAHLLAAAGFAAHHLVVTAVFFPLPYAVLLTTGVAVGGLVWSWLYERSNSIAAPWISHFLVDAAIMVIAYGILFG